MAVAGSVARPIVVAEELMAEFQNSLLVLQLMLIKLLMLLGR